MAPQFIYAPGTKFTPELYNQYIREPQYVLDGFMDPEEHRGWYAATIYEWYNQSKSRTEKWKDAAKKAIKIIEHMEDASATYTNIDDGLAHSPIALAWAYIQERTALLSNNAAQPLIVAQQESQNQYVSAINHIAGAELTANNFDQLINDCCYDGAFYNVAYLKTLVDDNRYGIYGQKGKICIERVHPDDMYPDPYAKQFSWEYWDYVIQKHDMEIGDIRQRWPITGFEISDTTESSMYTSMETQKSEDNIVSPIPKLAKGPAVKRQHIAVFECWFKDSRLKFVPKYDEPTEELNEYGESVLNPKPFLYDDDGYIIGDWLPAFPNGRCIVTAEHVILQDLENRLPHGSSPFTPIKFAPSENPFVSGDAVRLLVLADKINDVLANIHSYGQREIQRPMLVEMGTLINQQHYKHIPNKANKIIPVNMGKIAGIMRLPYQEVPQFVWQLIAQYLQLMDLISGSSAIMRGSIQDGAQLSAQAVQQLQGSASCRVNMQHKQLATGIKEAGRQVMWLIRRTYDQKIQVQVAGADGSPMNFDWESDKEVFESGDMEEITRLISTEDYIVDVKPGTGSPQAKEARVQMAMQLYDKKAIDRLELLNASEYPGRQQINQRMEGQFKDRIAAEAAGRKLGMSVIKAEKGVDTKPVGAPPKLDTYSPS